MSRIVIQLFLLFIFNLSGFSVCFAGESRTERLSLNEFITLAAQKDTAFEKILIDELIINYQKDLNLPAGDLLLTVKHNHDFFLADDRSSPSTEISLDKLFPETGTEIDLSYEVGASMTSATRSSRINFNVSQPVARNAFGRSTRLLDQIVGLEMEVARHQVIEAYEDYLALLTTAYCEWYEAWLNHNIGRSSYQENQKLLDDIRKRQQQNIALPIDVNKVELQVLAKKERLLELEESLKNSLQLIKTVIRYDDNVDIFPVEPEDFIVLEDSFEDIFTRFEKESRTFAILKTLEEKSSLQVEKDAEDLFPSIDLVAGYEVQGEGYGLENSGDKIYAGVKVEWPFTRRVKKAEHEIARVLATKSKLETENTWYRLYSQLTSLYLEIEREAKLIKVADDKISLSRSILKDETENYSFGKVTLNDYIQAVNILDTNRFNKVRHESLHRKLLVEWLRLMDMMVSRKSIKRPAGFSRFKQDRK